MVPGFVLGALCATAAPVWAQTVDFPAPLSAIDWLSESVEQPPVAVTAPVLGTQATRVPDADEAPVANSATSPNVSVQTLGGPAERVLGLLPPSATGFQSDLWENSDGAILGALLQAQQIDTLPALQDLITTLIVTQANPPRSGAGGGTFFLDRVDKLLDFGALEPAQAMLEDAVPDTSVLYQRWFDVSLLTGTEDAACRSLQSKPDVAPTPSVRIFCLARSGDWSAAALTLNTGLALGDIDDETGALLSRFLDPELYEGEPDLARPDRITPLTFRMFEAIGSPLTTNGLPRAFSHADLRQNVGWKAQLEAAERLARAGAVSSNVLMGLYTQRVPAASGGVWERAKAVQNLEAALARGNGRDIARALPRLWSEAHDVGVLTTLAQTHAQELLAADIPAAVRSLTFKMLLLSDQYEAAALVDPLAFTDPFLASVARGTPDDSPSIWLGSDAVRAGFAADADTALMDMAEQGRVGEAILRTIATLQQGIDRDVTAFAVGIATLRALGLEDTARRASLQYLLLR
jgi:hypothetical protein